MHVLRLMSLKFIQHLPLVVGFVAALPFWQRADQAVAIGCMVAGSLVGALAIHCTEPAIVVGHRETTQALIGNTVVFAFLMALLVLYLSAGWSTWWTDIVAGLLAALVMEVIQDLVARERLGLARSLWLGGSCSVGLLLLRLLLRRSAVLAVLIVAAWVTLVMGIYYLCDVNGEPEPARLEE